jgi:hypothetical protein
MNGVEVYETRICREIDDATSDRCYSKGQNRVGLLLQRENDNVKNKIVYNVDPTSSCYGQKKYAKMCRIRSGNCVGYFSEHDLLEL